MTDWLTWRKETAGSLTWRVARPSDEYAIAMLYHCMEERIGPQDRPRLWESPVLLTLVGLNENGTIVCALYVEAVAELTMIGLSHDGFEGAGELLPELSHFLLERKFRIARITIPKKLGTFMRATLAKLGFVDDDKLEHFTRLLRW